MSILPSFQTAPEEIVEQRREICKTCSNNNLGVCSVCYCVIHLKTQRAAQQCPELKWKKVVET